MRKHALLLVAVALAGGACSRKEQPAAQRRPAEPAATVDPATAATITGKVLFTGSKPVPREIRMDSEPICKGDHTGPVRSEDAAINDNGTVQYAVVYVKDGLGDKRFDPPAQPAILDQKGCVYRPHVLSVMAGQEINVLNSDSTTHNVHPIPRNNDEWNESQPPKGDKLVKRFTNEEIAIPVKCNVHPWMRSYVAVVKNPYHAVTGNDGTYTLKNLPPGEYTIALWTERFGTQEQKVSLAAKDSKTADFTVRAGSAR